MKLFFILLFTGCYFLFSPAVPAFAQADFSCQTIYGGGQTCESVGGLVLDNTVMNPKTNKMVNNLGSSDPRYEPGSMVVLQIKLTNTSGSTFQEVDVKDMLPPYVNFMGGDGNFDEATKTLSFRVSGLKPNEPKIYNVLGRIVDASQLPGVRSVSCVANIATAAVVDPASAKDTAQFCIEKKTRTNSSIYIYVYANTYTNTRC